MRDTTYRNRLRRAREHALLCLFPRRCAFCGGVTVPRALLCGDCEGKAEAVFCAPRCLRCGRVLADCVCAQKERALPVLSVFSYHSAARGFLLRMKFHGEPGWAPSLGYAMADRLCTLRLAGDAAELRAWLFCAVPMTKRQERARGFNQSRLLAGYAAAWLGAAFMPGMLTKRCETKVQHGLPAEEREQNVAGAYAVPEAALVRGRKIVLCDDVTTTGATLRACAAQLLAAGAAEVVCLTFLETKLEASGVSHGAYTIPQ
ncbi:MAG: hypothetical protein LBQ33_02930 [Oscillospiraceae bacterium]|nr:hypothetical protein [Oscillospiraceae bacterium]